MVQEEHPIFGFTLAGGGARGAYSAGVLRYVLRELPKRLGRIPWPQLVSGTSVGALNGYFAATHSMDEIKRMTKLWTEIEPAHVFDLPGGGAFRIVRSLFSQSKEGYLLSNEPLRNLIISEAKRRSLRHSIEKGKCWAFIVSATQLTSGLNTLFVERSERGIHIPDPPRGNVVYTKIYPEHLIGSIAVPLLFSPERIKDRLYVDGGVRQNTPLKPVIQAGAERILVLSTRAKKPTPTNDVDKASLSLVAGKTLNALTLDPVIRDAQYNQTLNELIDLGTRTYGDGFAKLVYEKMGIRKTEILNIQPSVDLGRLAVQTYNPKTLNAPSGTKWLLSKLFDQEKESGESDFLSQILFDKSYTVAAEELGFSDAQNMEEELLHFFSE